jgi:hypothetical protein
MTDSRAPGRLGDHEAMASAGSGRPRGTTVLLLLLAAAPTMAASGCSNPAEPQVRDVASSFADGDPQRRCELLAPTTLATLLQDDPSCPRAIAQLPVGTGDVVSVEVWSEDAQVRLADDTFFLTRGRTGWQVSAAACTPVGEGPYQCELEAS